jgi:hypothetical protein
LQTYRVFGTRYQNYYILVDAADPYEAAEIANASPSISWNQLPMDDEIEATDVYLNEDIDTDLQLNI